MMGVLYNVETHTIKAYVMNDERIKSGGSILTIQIYKQEDYHAK